MARGNTPRGSPWSVKIASPFGIPIRLHFTFILFLVWLMVLASNEGNRAFALLVPAIFACVVLHEFGHALVAKAFGVKTRDVTLYPIGGIAMLESRPKPHQEVWIALAGPAVNVVLAAILYPVALAVDGRPPSLSADLDKATFLEGLFVANVYLPVFNMIPALPMDGGRVLRALLALRLPEVRATQISASVAQLAAMVLGFVGLLQGNVVLTVIALLVFFGAGQEAQASAGMALIEGRKVSEAMMTQYEVLTSGATLGQAAELLLKGSQTGFPVVVGDEVIGLLSRDALVRGLSADGPSAYIAAHMIRDFVRLDPDQSLEGALHLMGESRGAPGLVFRDDQLVGVFTGENLAEFMMVQQALKRR